MEQSNLFRTIIYEFQFIRRDVALQRLYHKISIINGLVVKILLPQKTLLFIIIIGFLIFPNPSYAKDLNLSELVDLAIKNNPEIKQLQQKHQASLFKIPQEKSLEDPMLSLNFSNIPLNVPAFGKEMTTGSMLSIAQKLPLTEKLELKGKASLLISNAILIDIEEKTNLIIKSVKNDFFELNYTNKIIELNEKAKKLLKEIQKLAETKYSVGQASQQDILKVAIQISKTNQKIIELKQKKNDLFLTLNYHLYHDLVKTFDSSDISQISYEKLKLTDLEKLAIKNRPLLKKGELEIQMAETDISMAKLEFFPDFEVMLGYGVSQDRADMVSGGVSINLPVWYKDKQNNRLKETEENLLASKSGYEAMKNEVLFNTKALLNKIKNQKEISDLLNKGMILQGEAYLKSSIASYQNGKGDFMSVLDSQMTLLDYKMTLYMSLLEQWMALSELEFEIGTKIK